MAKEFYNKLINYVSSNNTTNAHLLLMSEVGKCLVKDKSNFIELLTSSGIPASESMSDVELVDLFVNAIPNNKSLMIGTSYMINSQNKFLSADGTEQISDKGVKLSYKIMYDFFTDDDSNSQEFSNAASDPVTAIAQAVGALANVGTAGIGASQKKKYGAMDALSKQSETRSQIIKSIIEQKQAQANAEAKKRESSQKTKRVLLIGGVVFVGLVVVGFILYKVKKGK